MHSVAGLDPINRRVHFGHGPQIALVKLEDAFDVCSSRPIGDAVVSINVLFAGVIRGERERGVPVESIE
jgi:hypothetical protein